MDPHATSSIHQCRVIDLPRHRHANGSLSVVDNIDAPFAVKRVFYVCDIPTDIHRGDHSHYRQRQLVIAASGSFDITITDGVETKTVTLNRPYRALLLEPGIWLSMHNFSSGVIIMAMSSEDYDSTDYVNDFEEFKRLTACKCEKKTIPEP